MRPCTLKLDNTRLAKSCHNEIQAFASKGSHFLNSTSTASISATEVMLASLGLYRWVLKVLIRISRHKISPNRIRNLTQVIRHHFLLVYMKMLAMAMKPKGQRKNILFPTPFSSLKFFKMMLLSFYHILGIPFLSS